MSEPWIVKLARANDLVVALGNESGPYEGTLKLDSRRRPDALNTWDLYMVQPTAPPQLLASLVGEILHNARSALDSYAFHRITSEVDLTDDEKRSVVFPITRKEKDFKKGRWHSGKVPSSLMESFAYAQPWFYLKDLDISEADKAASIANDPLVTLADMNNEDKHRNMHPVVAGLNVVWSGLPEGVTQTATDWGPLPWVHGSRVVSHTFSGLRDHQSPGFGHQFTLALEEDATPLNCNAMFDRLRSCLRAAENAIWKVGATSPFD